MAAEVVAAGEAGVGAGGCSAGEGLFATSVRCPQLERAKRQTAAAKEDEAKRIGRIRPADTAMQMATVWQH